MSAGVKKPPLAPKPKLPGAGRPCPPPIAPKPVALPSPPPLPPPAVSQPSPATLKRTKPAVAPKPCIPKSTASSPPVSPPPPRSCEPATLCGEQVEGLASDLSLLNSKNGILSETDRRTDSDYIIPSGPCDEHRDSSPPPHHSLENGSAAEVGAGSSHGDGLPNGVSAEGSAPERKAECGRSRKPRDKPQRQRHLGKVPVNDEEPKSLEVVNHQESPAAEQEGPKVDIQAELQDPRDPRDFRDPRDPSDPQDPRDSACDAAGSVASHQAPPGLLPEAERAVDEAPPTGQQPDLQVPAAPSKPLPVPQPRKHKKAVLVRQDGVEQLGEARPEELKADAGEETPPPCADAGLADAADADAPVPPPRQTSLSPRLHRTHPLDKKASYSLMLLAQPDPGESNDQQQQQQGEEEEDGGYGDFERYPSSHSLPKQIKLACHPPRGKSLPSDDQGWPRAPPRKPQRYSLPAAAAPSICPPAAPPHASTPMRELPAPPQERAAWRFTFFSRQVPARSSMPPKSRVPTAAAAALGGKQRAQSFSAADLATRADPHKRGLSFRKLLELRLSVKMLPKLLAKGSHSLDCTTAGERGRGGRTRGGSARPKSCSGEVDICREEQQQQQEEGEEQAEYENVPLYEEIPEYMNLPFHSARQAWSHDPGAADASDIYEVQDPYLRYQEHEYESGWQDVHSEEEEEEEEEEGSHSSEEDSSSTSSKEHLDEADRQQEAETKRKKVVHIAQEIMSSEKVFVDVLKLLHIDFRDAVATATRQNGKPVVDERILSQVLYYLPQLYQLNRDLLRELEERVAQWGDHQRLADIFVQKGPYLKMYSTYIRQFDNNVALLDEQCRKNAAFAAVVREFETSPRCASLALKHYLLKPVQRIPQYQLLLTDYLKNLPEDSEDYKDTQAALSIVKEVANHANDIMKQGDNFQKLMHIQYSLTGHHEIVQPGRVFLKQGTLMKLSRKVMQPRMFFLFNDALMYTTPVQSGQFKLNSVLSLAGMKVSKPSQEAYQNELNIESVERSFILSAGSATERDQWLEAIAKAIDDYTKKKITFISSRSQEEGEGAVDNGAPLGSKAPIWIPDLRATMCMICTCEFTLTWRRHHCRACGKVVCQACSANKYYLEYLKNQPARVCDHCFAKLQENSDRCASTSISPIKSGAFSFTRKQKKIPAALKEVSANTENSSMSGYLNRSKGNKKQWKRLWFVIKNKVLYTYAASEDVAALESQPLLGFFLREEKNGPAQKLQFKLYHKNNLYYMFRADDIPTAQRWIEAFQEAMILESDLDFPQ
ncbi:uncharacterized protein LOC142890694 [Nelusetta ayraudi]|uniref:uncharacterized protein LOC142890694 n=1 Tax=Nelusetta ayraudi TaxID=303726 RepID=UPI003F6EF5ED